jgi:hypothetical protein
MALHRDIYWVGRQWAVTGYGMQAVDPRLKGRFDIEATRLWEDGLSEGLNAGAWLNAEDFAKALAVARARHPQPPPGEVAEPSQARASGPTLGVNDGAPTVSPEPQVPRFAMQIEHWPAKFLRPWRARLRR